MDYKYIADEIKSRISAKELLSVYGIEINTRGFARCPFHNERTASFKVYDGDRGYHCFGCGKSGDVITFVRDYFGLSFVDAIKKINDDFALGLPIGQNVSRAKQTEMARQAYRRKKQIEADKAESDRLESEYWSAYDRWLKYHNDIIDCRPESPAADWNPLFVEAAQNIAYQQYLMECAYEERYEHEQERRGR